jgi:hypothetical protein
MEIGIKTVLADDCEIGDNFKDSKEACGLLCFFLFYAPAPSLGEEVGPLKVLHVNSEGQI